MEGRSLAGVHLSFLSVLSAPNACIESGKQHTFYYRFMAFDRHMNLVLGDSEEFRKLPPKKGKSDDEVSL